MASLGQILSRTFFWSYERGTWQYDLAVILILVFVLVTPRGWFHDKPQSGAPVTPGQVQFISKDGNRLTYRVDVRILRFTISRGSVRAQECSRVTWLRARASILYVTMPSAFMSVVSMPDRGRV